MKTMCSFRSAGPLSPQYQQRGRMAQARLRHPRGILKSLAGGIEEFTPFQRAVVIAPGQKLFMRPITLRC